MNQESHIGSLKQHHESNMQSEKISNPNTGLKTSRSRWKRMLDPSNAVQTPVVSRASSEGLEDMKTRPEKWSMGVLNDRETDEVPGSVLLMSHSKRNEPLGLRNAPARISASSLPSPFPPELRPSATRTQSERSIEERKRTKDGKIILEPQPEPSMNDPLNWPSWRRDVALLSLGFFCMLGGGMTPILAAGFDNVANTFNVSIPKVALTTGFYMLGLGLGSVVASPTAILFGKRPVYLVAILLFIVSAIWCAASPNYASLVVARIFMGLAVSPCECLPSATIAEIFFLHERAYRLGIYTLLLLSGKNLIPLVSAVIIEGLDWRWVFWIVAIVVGFCFATMFFFVPETFWDRTPRPYKKSRKTTYSSLTNLFHNHHQSHAEKGTSPNGEDDSSEAKKLAIDDVASAAGAAPATIATRRQRKETHRVGFVGNDESIERSENEKAAHLNDVGESPEAQDTQDVLNRHQDSASTGGAALASRNFKGKEDCKVDSLGHDLELQKNPTTPSESVKSMPVTPALSTPAPVGTSHYTNHLRTQPAKTFRQTLKPWNGRLRKENWLKVAMRPFILFAYPAVLWSTLVYSLSIGWLIVLSESVSEIYRNKDTYNFSALQTGLVYISPFVGGVLGTAVAGKVSDVIVRFMSRRNGGIYEPEFRLVMAIPVMISTCVGLMGFGWSAAERDNWAVPTIFFGIISFGCSLGSTTSITFAVDSYRQYAGEALVTLNFSKNIFHGLVFSLFFNHWLEAEGSKSVFLAIGGIQIACLLTTIPMYIYGKRARMWTVRKNLMEKF